MPRNRSGRRGDDRPTRRRPLRDVEARLPSCRRAMTGALPCVGSSAASSSASRSRGSVPSTRSLPILPRFTRTETGRIPQWRRAASSPSGSGRPRPTERRAATHPPRRSFHSAGSRAPRRTRARPSRRAARTAPSTQTRFTTKPRVITRKTSRPSVHSETGSRGGSPASSRVPRSSSPCRGPWRDGPRPRSSSASSR